MFLITLEFSKLSLRSFAFSLTIAPHCLILIFTAFLFISFSFIFFFLLFLNFPDIVSVLHRRAFPGVLRARNVSVFGRPIAP